MMESPCLTLTNCLSLTKFYFFTFDSTYFSLVFGKCRFISTQRKRIYAKMYPIFTLKVLLEELCPYNQFLIFLEW